MMASKNIGHIKQQHKGNEFGLDPIKKDHKTKAEVIKERDILSLV